MSATEKNPRDDDFSAATVRPCATLADTDGKRGAHDEARAVWLAVLQGLAIISAAIRRHLKLTIRCERCGK